MHRMIEDKVVYIDNQLVLPDFSAVLAQSLEGMQACKNLLATKQRNTAQEAAMQSEGQPHPYQGRQPG